MALVQFSAVLTSLTSSNVVSQKPSVAGSQLIMTRYEFEPGAKRGRNKLVGVWTETPATPIDLPLTLTNLTQLLAIGGDACDGTYTHQQIANWCDRYYAQYYNDPSIRDETSDFDIANDVSAQWGLTLVNSYTLAELQSLDFSSVVLPLEWFNDWSTKLNAADRRLPTSSELSELVRIALWQDWDPIGINDCPEAQDEYDSYVGGICSLLNSGADSHMLGNHLSQIETKSMGLSAPCSHLEDVVVKLLAMVGR